MKKSLFVSLLFLLKISNTNAQLIDTDFINNIGENKKNVITDKSMFVKQIMDFQIKKEITFLKRKNKGKNKRKSKFGIIFLNFAEHNFRTFTC